MVNWTQRRKLKRDICVSVVVLVLSVASHGIVLSLPVFVRTPETPLKVTESFPEEDVEVVILPRQELQQEEASEEETFLLPEAADLVPEAAPPPANAAELEDESLPLDSEPEPETKPERKLDPDSNEGNKPQPQQPIDPPVTLPPPTAFGENFTPYDDSVSCGVDCFQVSGAGLLQDVRQSVNEKLRNTYDVDRDDSEQPPGRRVYKLTHKENGTVKYLILVSTLDSVTYAIREDPNASLPS